MTPGVCCDTMAVMIVLDMSENGTINGYPWEDFLDQYAAGAKCPGGILLEKGRAMGNTVAVEVANMLAAAWLMLSSLFYSLQLSSGSFPRPLTEEEERYYLDLAGKGDLEARNVLIERNLRLVAHIMKN